MALKLLGSLESSGGNVGIGATDPGTKLEVNSGGTGAAARFTGTANFSEIYLGSNGVQSQYTNIVWYTNNGNAQIWKAGTAYTAAGGAGALNIYNSNGNISFHPAGQFNAMTIDSYTNVGIGSTAPAAKLNVASTGANAYSSTITKGTNMKGIINVLSSNADDMVGIYFGTGVTSEGTHWSGITGSRSQNGVDWSTQLNFYTHDENVSNLNDATQKMVIKGSGNVGIGTTSPQQKLHIKSTTSGPTGIIIENTNNAQSLDLDFWSNAGAAQGRIRYNEGAGSFDFSPNVGAGSAMTMLYTGNVGIGTTSPAYKLDVNGGIQLNGKSALTDNAYFVGSPSYGFRWNNSADTFNNVIMYDNGNMYVRGNVGIGTTSPADKLHVSGGNIRLDNGAGDGFIKDSAGNDRFYFGTGTYLNSNTGGPVAFQVAGSEKMRVNYNGNVGIGTTNPEQKLHVEGAIQLGNTEDLAWAYDNGSYYNYITNFYNTSNGMTFRAGSWTSGNNIDFCFQTYYGGSWSTKLAIRGDGYVGIGTASPATKLQVDGVITATGGNSTDWNTAYGWGNHAGLYDAAGSAGAVDLRIEEEVLPAIDAKLDATAKAADSELLDGLDSSSFVRSDATDTLNGHYTFLYNSGIIDSAQPGYTQGAIEIETTDNNTPAIGFHRGGYSATALYEYDGQLYVNPWVDRAQEGLLLSSGNISAYADAAGAAAVVNTRIEEEILPAIDTVSSSIPTNNNQLTNGAGYITDGNTNWNNTYGFIARGDTQNPGSWPEATKFKSTGDIGTDTSSNHSLQIYADEGTDAFMAFHISNDYAVFLGLENDTNRLYTGGWSLGNIKHQIWDSRDFSSTNISNWNTAYGWGNHAGYGYWVLDNAEPKNVQAETVTFIGSVTVEGTFTESSSIRFKENITSLDPALDKVNQLEAVSYNKIGVDDREIGLIAEDVAELFPEVVTYNEEGQPQGIQYQRLSVILLKAMQELSQEVNELKKKLN